MKNEIQINDELIAKYLTGEANPDEALALHDWLAVPANQLYFIKLQHTWNETYPSINSRKVDLERAWAEVDVKRSRIPSDLKDNTTKYTFPKNAFRLAASVIIVLAFGLMIYFNSKGVSAMIGISSTDSLRHIKLADNSTVVLHQNTTISFPETFDKNLREVQLTEGEAFFDIEHNTEIPFIIRTKLANIQVIGTAFNVALTKNFLQVSVAQGKVMVYSATDSIYLDPGNKVSFGSSETFPEIQESDPNAWAYATHKLIFKDTPLNEVFRYVEKAKLCSIQLRNKDIGNCRLTATFDNVSTDYMLTLISEALNLSVTKNDNIFTVGGEGCQ